MQPNAANPVGFYENLEIYRINESILEGMGATWFEPPTRAAQSKAAEQARRALAGSLARLTDESDGLPLAIKDPRIGVLLDIWEPLIKDALHPVLAVRHPLEIALSLAERDGTPIPLSLASWELHSARLLSHLNGREVTVAPYARLLASGDAVTGFVADVTSQLDECCARHVRPALAAQAIEASLYRARAAVDGADQLTPRQVRLWSYLKALPAGTQRLIVPDELTREDEYARALTAVETGRVTVKERLQRSEARLAEQTRQVAELEAALGVMQSRLHFAEREREELRLAQQRTEHWLLEIQRSLSWRITAPLRSILRASRLLVRSFPRARPASVRVGRRASLRRRRDRARRS